MVMMAADRKWSDAVRKRVVEMYLAGAKLKDIEAETGVKGPTTYHFVKEAGHAPQRMTKRKTEPKTQAEQVSVLEWHVQQLYAQRDEIARLLAILAEYGIDPVTGEVTE